MSVPVSVCLIVRNEERASDCLDSVAPFVAEMIVVDTGSTDRTREIATSYGARATDFSWCDDFAAARNFATRLATQPGTKPCLASVAIAQPTTWGSSTNHVATSREPERSSSALPRMGIPPPLNAFEHCRSPVWGSSARRPGRFSWGNQARC